MKVFLYICAAIFLIGPIIIWTLLSAMKCAYVNSSNCSVNLNDFMDGEFFMLYAIPFVIGIACVYFANTRKAKS
ncbi:MAG: hypothetical protein JJ858_04285 [Rhizobiaceae bacterium]|nr:hypothetical protein [Rhizobiaceae bacterium]